MQFLLLPSSHDQLCRGLKSQSRAGPSQQHQLSTGGVWGEPLGFCQLSSSEAGLCSASLGSTWL